MLDSSLRLDQEETRRGVYVTGIKRRSGKMQLVRGFATPSSCENVVCSRRKRCNRECMLSSEAPIALRTKTPSWTRIRALAPVSRSHALESKHRSPSSIQFLKPQPTKLPVHHPHDRAACSSQVHCLLVEERAPRYNRYANGQCFRERIPHDRHTRAGTKKCCSVELLSNASLMTITLGKVPRSAATSSCLATSAST